MTHYINQIYSTFHNAPDSHMLVIKGSKEQGYLFEASAVCNEAVSTHTQKTFREIFQEYPIQEILKDHSSTLTKSTLRQIFVRLAVFEDKGPPLQFGTLEEFEQVFLDQAPKGSHFIQDKARTSGKGFEGLCERVYLQWHHYFTTQSEQDPHKAEIRHAEFLTSRMADREFQEKAYIHLADGEVFQVDKIIVSEGAYISILKNISDQTRLKIICRGTAMRRTATDGIKSGLNDLHYEIGNGGVQAAWPILSEYLAGQELTIEIYGKSLGGAHAQRLAILLMKLPNCLLQKLTTVCSVGVGPEAELLFKNLIERDERYHHLNLTVIRNGGEALDQGADYIPCIGGEHLGSTVNPEYLNLRLYHIHPSAGQIFPPNQNLNFFQKGLRFLSSFSSAHVRQTTFTDFSYQHLEDRESIQSALKLGITLEGPRRWIAYRNPVSFTDFVNSTKTSARAVSSGKVAAIVSSIFLLLFSIGFIVCLVLQPGSLVYQGHGIILTLPAILMAGGGILSLMSIAIGSCSWWLYPNALKNRFLGHAKAPAVE